MSDFSITDAEPRPDLHQDSSPIEYDGEMKAAIKWERNAGEYVVLWNQDKFRIFDGYSMSGPLREIILNEIGDKETLYVVSKEESKIHKFNMTALEEAQPINPDHRAAQGDVIQYVVSEDDIIKSWDQ